MHDYTRLDVWWEARRCARLVYELTDELPRAETFGLRSQMRRAAISIASNVAEGAGRSSDRDFARFIEFATGSAAELETQLLIASDVALLDQRRTDDLIVYLRSLRRRLEALRTAILP